MGVCAAQPRRTVCAGRARLGWAGEGLRTDALAQGSPGTGFLAGAEPAGASARRYADLQQGVYDGAGYLPVLERPAHGTHGRVLSGDEKRKLRVISYE